MKMMRFFRRQVALLKRLIKGIKSDVCALFSRTWRSGVQAYDGMVAVGDLTLEISRKLAEVP